MGMLIILNSPLLICKLGLVIPVNGILCKLSERTRRGLRTGQPHDYIHYIAWVT